MRSDSKSTSRMVVLLGMGLLFGACFWHVVFLPNNFAVRDTAKFYYPLFRYVQDELSAQRLPLWNPYDDCGTPLAANATSSVFYPGKLIFLLPIPFDSAFKTYILAHVVLAAFGVWIVSRSWQLTETAGGLAAAAYAFGAGVLFQYSNVVFLCGAAWLPYALWSGERLLESRRFSWVIALGGILAMMVLSGDPQSAYHAGLILGIRWLVSGVDLLRVQKVSEPAASRGRQRREKIRQQKKRQAVSWWDLTSRLFAASPVRSLLALLGAAGVGLLLGAIQLLPSAQFSSQSERSVSNVPLSIWQVPSHLIQGIEPIPRPDTKRPANWYDGLVGNPPSPAKHYYQIFSFSLPPWQVLECVWPNLMGKALPGETRLATAWEGMNVWMPSIYFGLIPLVFALSAFRLWSGERTDRWLSWTVLVFLLGSFGRYGFVWLFDTISSSEAYSNPVDDGVGGIYWMMTVLLPFYSVFRFPAKLWTVAALGLALLASRQLSACSLGQRKPPTAIFGWLSILSCFFTILLAASLMFVQDSAHISEWIFSVLQTAIVAGISWWCLSRSARFQQRTMWVLFAITCCDLAIANSWLVESAPSKIWHQRPILVRLFEESQQTRDSDQDVAPRRVFLPERWLIHPGQNPQEHSSAEKIAHDLDSLDSMSHLLWRIPKVVVHGGTTLQYAVHQAWFDLIPIPQHGLVVHPRRAYDVWGTSYFAGDDWPEFEPLPKDAILSRSPLGIQRRWTQPRWDQKTEPWPTGPFLPEAVPNPEEWLPQESKSKVFFNTDVCPRTWVVHRLEVHPPLRPNYRPSWLPILQSMVFPEPGTARDPLSTAVVHDSALSPDADSQILELGQKSLDTEEPCRILEYQPGRIVVAVDLESEGMLMLSETWDSGWRAKVLRDGESELSPAKVERANITMCGVRLSPGRQRVTFTYFPQSFVWGAILSGLSWIACVLFFLGKGFSGRKSRCTNSDSSAEG